MPRNTRNINLLLYGILGLCVTGCIFLLLIPEPTTTLSPTPSVPVSVQSPTPTDKKQDSQTYWLCIADVPNVPNMLVQYGGSTSFAPLGENKPFHIAIKKAHPNFNLKYKEPPLLKKPGSRTGIEMLLDGQLNFSLSSQGLKGIRDKELDRAKNMGFTLKPEPVASDGIAIYVNPELITQGLQGLTLSQVEDIFTGKITNWKDVKGIKNWKNGKGPDLEITPFSRDLNASGTVEFFYENVLNGKQPVSNLRQEVPRDTTHSGRSVASTLGGIGFATASEVINQKTISPLPIAKDDKSPFISPCADGSCTSVNQTAIANTSYPLTRRLFVVIKQDGNVDQQAGEAYANMLKSDEGQKLVDQAGFSPLRIFNTPNCQRP